MISSSAITSEAGVAVLAEIALLGVPLPDLEDVGEGGIRAACTLCGDYWDHPELNGHWRWTDYEPGVLEAYVQHVREEHMKEAT